MKSKENNDLEEKIAKMIKALIDGGYNAKPTKLRQGCITALFFNEDGTVRQGTDEEWDKLYDDTFGKK